ncbi:hypothetical protein [Candidatus Neptunichlamydia sp. REUL1]|nr:hypothetical protein [Candidatus Neptunochlamydia sp. REUL1]
MLSYTNATKEFSMGKASHRRHDISDKVWELLAPPRVRRLCSRPWAIL